MATKTVPRERTGNWIVWDGDPSGETQYLVKPLSNSAQSHVAGSTPFKKTGRQISAEGGYVAITIFRVGLKGLKGVIDSDSGQPVELKFERLKVGTKKMEAVQEELYDLLPSDLMGDILDSIRGASDFGEDEADAVDFTPVSSVPTSTAENATETSETVSTDQQ